MTDAMAETAKQASKFHLCITPEGTRSRVEEWKKGFYYMAKGAGVPLQLAFIDGERKTAGIALTLNLSGNEADDLGKIKKFYSTVSPLKKGNFCLPENF
jgi:1-acyl-sn-glycerol-3-phosphate acyltransferase